MRLIDADVLTDSLDEWEENAVFGTENDGTDGTTMILQPVPTTTREMEDLIGMQPTVDAVEVVRCKDCGDWREYGDDHVCEHFSSFDLPGLCENIRFVTRPDDYCSFGFRIKQSEKETEELK